MSDPSRRLSRSLLLALSHRRSIGRGRSLECPWLDEGNGEHTHEPAFQCLLVDSSDAEVVVKLGKKIATEKKEALERA